MKRMDPILEAAGIAVLGFAAVIAIAARRLNAPAVEQRDICYPEDTFVPSGPGWPTWTVCEDSNGYHTCWRPLHHDGRHTEWDLSTGKVTATWPCHGMS